MTEEEYQTYKHLPLFLNVLEALEKLQPGDRFLTISRIGKKPVPKIILEEDEDCECL